jgi:hypothetical protein
MSDADELYPGQKREVAERAAREAAYAQANGAVLPGPLAEAIEPEPVEVAGLRVRRVVHYDFVLLRRLNSPLLKQLARAAEGQAGGTEFSDEDAYVMVWQFTRPVREAAAYLAEHGANGVRAAALESIGCALGPVEVGLLVQAVEREFVRALSTVVKYEPARPAGADGGGAVFMPPPAGRMTGSAGG